MTLRPATPDDLAGCEHVWREGINDYLRPLARGEIGPDNPALRRLHAHALATDPGRFWVATRRSRRRIVAFGSAVERGPLWFLSMLFVEPRAQGRGLGRALLDRLMPAAPDDRVLATATDSAQPISNGLYASLGFPPRLPLFNLVGRPRPGRTLPALPDGVRAVPIRDESGASAADTDRTDGGAPDGTAGGPTAEIDALDREVLGFAHREDHDFVRADGRIGFAYRDRGGALLGYGYASTVGRIGPIAVRDRALLPAVLAHLLTAVEPRGASSAWIPGVADGALAAALDAGLRIEGFPVLLCWSRPFADFGRYLPMSPGLL